VEAAQSLGAEKWATFYKITLPLIIPGVLVGALFGFLISFTDVTLTLFISSSGSPTFPVRVYSEQRSEGLNQIVLAWSAIITLVIFILSLIGEKFARWSRYF
jgi:putative spermidine/putrescine transport system permease protein